MIRVFTWPLRGLCWAVILPTAAALFGLALLGKIVVAADNWLGARELSADIRKAFRAADAEADRLYAESMKRVQDFVATPQEKRHG